MKTRFLLHVWFRPLGNLFLCAGIAMLMARFYFGIKPEFFEIKVFAILSVYLETKYMAIIQNQFLEELAGLLVLSGLFMMAFAKEKTETEQINTIRLNAFFLAAYGTFIFLVITFIFTYGMGFAYMVMINVPLWLLIYLIAFRYLLYRNNRTSHLSSDPNR